MDQERHWQVASNASSQGRILYAKVCVLTLDSVALIFSKALTVAQVYPRDHGRSGCPWQEGQGESFITCKSRMVSLSRVPGHPCSYPSLPGTGEATGRVSVAVSHRTSCAQLTVATSRTEWQRDVVDDEHLSVVHEIVPKK